MQFSGLPLPGHYFRLLAAFIFTGIIPDSQSCIAQTSHEIFEHLTTDHGLSSDKSEAVLQDKEGFYWIATQNGLNRFDGTNFKVFRHKSNDSTSLTNNYCTALAEDLNGDIWITTYRGVSRFLKKKGCFQQIYLTHPSRNFEITNRTYALAVDNTGKIWIAGNGLWRYDTVNDSIRFFQNNPSDPSSVTSYGMITHIVYDKKNNGLWYSTAEQIGFYDASQKQFYHRLHNPLQWGVFKVADGAELTLDNKNRLWFRDHKSQSLSFFETDNNLVTLTRKKINYGIQRICSDERGRIWIFYYLARSEIYDPETRITNADFFTIHHRLSVLSEQGNSLFIDRQNNYWIPSFNGVSIYNESKQYYKLHKLILEDKGIEQATFRIKALAQTEAASIWVGTNLGLYKYDLLTGAYKSVALDSPEKNIIALCPDGEKLWIAIDDHLFCLDTKKEKVVKNIRLNADIFFVRQGINGKLWAGSWLGGLYRIDAQSYAVESFKNNQADSTSLRSNTLITGVADRDNFWVGYNGGNGFSLYSTASNAFTHYHPQEKDLSSSSAGTITSITPDGSGYIWLGTHGSGIFRFDPSTNTYEKYQQEHGLNSNFINSIVSDSSGNLWISTADGMNFYASTKQSIQQLDVSLVFQDNDVEANGIYGLNGRVYFYCKNEFVEIDPLAYQPDTTFPQIVISSFKIFDKEAMISGQEKRINLSYQENFFSFEFSAIKANPVKEVKYAYKLEGFDRDWITAGPKNQASYTNVPEGNYQFKVKATNDDEIWSDVLLALPIHIKPPFWHTWWFITLSVVSVSSLVYSLYRFRIHQINKLALLRSKISQDLHDELGSALSSIHVYSSVASKSLDKNVEITKKALNNIFKNSRQVMDTMSDIVWAINQDRVGESTLENKLKNYGYELLTPLNINVIYAIDKEAEHKINHIEARKNILLIVKEAMNNVARYSGATEASVCIEIVNKQMLLKIKDNGRGISVTNKKNGNGLFNMRHRTESMGGKFVLESEENKGTSLTCSIPITSISNT